MLRWRLVLGTLIIAALVGLCWLDHRAPAGLQGVWLAPVLVALAVLATHEILVLESAVGLAPVPWVVYAGNLAVLTSPWAACLLRHPGDGSCVSGTAAAPSAGHAVALTLAIMVILALVAEMRRYQRPGTVIANTAAAAFALCYVGLLLSFAVELRLRWGVGALASLLIVVKSGDSGAYFVGRLFGRHKMAPTLSPRKTIEGAYGACLFSVAASWAVFAWLVPWARLGASEACGAVAPWWAWIGFGLLVGGAGILGDLAESLLKRDGGRKDSSTWIPGLGGVLDVLDSVLVAAPVAYLFWSLGVVS
jgi:phosphatidate cytidylyltransferase